MSIKVPCLLTLSGIVLAPQLAVADVPEEFLESPLASLFGEPPTIADPMLAPDGSRLLFMQQNPLGISMLLALDFEDGSIDVVMEPFEEGYDILWCRFANETRVMCDLRQVGPPNRTPDYHRYVAVNSDGTGLDEMPPRIGCQRYDDLRDQPFVDWMPDDPEQVLLPCPMGGIGAGPKFLDIYTGRLRETIGTNEFGSWETQRIDFPAGGGIDAIYPIESGPGELGRAQVLYVNGHGLANLFRGREDNVDRWFVRDDVRGGWENFLTLDPMAWEPPLLPAGYGNDTARLFNIGWDPAAQAWGLYRRDLTGSVGGEGGDSGADGGDSGGGQAIAPGNERVYSLPGVDIELVDTMGKYQRVVAAAFLEGSPRRAIVDPRVAEVYQSVAALLPDVDVEIVDESWDRNRYVIRTRAANRAPELVLVDMANETVEPLVPEYAQLADVELAETTFVEIESSTGGTITGNLTLPPAADGPVPAVILPRSQATHEAIADPHYLVQFLAASGYAVLRINNRVAAELGRGWAPERAIAGWEQSAEDINDAVSYLIDNDISATGMICGGGKDYGAYVALMTAIRYPALLSCVFSIGGVTNPSDEPGGIVLTARGDRDRLNAASPVRRVAELEAPTLLFHGYGDTDFDVAEQSLRFATEAETAGKDVTFIEYPYANQQIRQRQYRTDMLTRIHGFLAANIGPALTELEAAGGVSQWRKVSPEAYE